MTLTSITNTDVQTGAPAHLSTNYSVSMGLREGVSATATTMESLEQDAFVPTNEFKGFCGQIGSKLKEFADAIWNALSGIFNTIKSFFGKGDSSVMVTPPDTPLEIFQKGLIFQYENREQIIAAFNQLPPLDRNAVTDEMYRLAGEDIEDENDIQPDERRPAEDWSGRVIRGEVQLPGEPEPREDIQRYSNRIGNNDDLLVKALRNIINEAAGVSRLPRNSFLLSDLQRLLSEENLNRILIFNALILLEEGDLQGVFFAMKDIAIEDLRRENSPFQMNLQSNEEFEKWSIRVMLNVVRERRETEDRMDILPFVDILAPNSAFRRAVDRAILANRSESDQEMA